MNEFCSYSNKEPVCVHKYPRVIHSDTGTKVYEIILNEISLWLNLKVIYIYYFIKDNSVRPAYVPEDMEKCVAQICGKVLDYQCYVRVELNFYLG